MGGRTVTATTEGPQLSAAHLLQPKSQRLNLMTSNSQHGLSLVPPLPFVVFDSAALLFYLKVVNPFLYGSVCAKSLTRV